MRVDTVLTDLLEATAAKTAASRRIDRLRDVLDNEARRRYAAEGAAPSWKAPKLGSVRLDPKPAKAYVADPEAFASYVAQRHPSEVTARIELDAVQLEAALSALEFAGVPVTRSAVEVRPQFAEALLANADVLYDDSDPAKIVKAVGTVDPTSGTLELIAGTDVLAPSASLVVTLDRDRKRAELERVDLDVDDRLAPLEAIAADPEAEAEAAAIGERLIAQAVGEHPAPGLVDALLDGLKHREPYVGTGADGARRSAEVDRNEADTYDRDHPRREELLASAERWEVQAGQLDAVEAEPPTIAEQQRAHAAARAAAITAELDAASAPGPELRTPPELEPVASLDEVSPPDPDPAAVARVNAVAGATTDQPVEPVPGVVDELVKLSSDDLKRAARNARVPLNGTKVLLAGRLARAGVTPADVVALRPA